MKGNIVLLIKFLKPCEGKFEIIVHTSNSIKNLKVLRRYVKSRIRDNQSIEDYKIIDANDTRDNSRYYVSSTTKMSQTIKRLLFWEKYLSFHYLENVPIYHEIQLFVR